MLLLLLVRLASVSGLVIFSVVEVGVGDDGVSAVGATVSVVTGVVAGADNGADASAAVGVDNAGTDAVAGTGTAGVGAGADIDPNSDLLSTARAWASTPVLRRARAVFS